MYESFSLYKPVHREFKRLRVIVGGLHNQYNADLADMQKLKEKNDGVRFLLIVIDMFSHHLWVEPLLNKTEESVIEHSGISLKDSKPLMVTIRSWRQIQRVKGGGLFRLHQCRALVGS